MRVTIDDVLNRQGKTRYWLSKETKITYPNIMKLCNNESSKIEFETIEKICYVLNCKIEEILQLETNKTKEKLLNDIMDSDYSVVITESNNSTIFESAKIYDLIKKDEFRLDNIKLIYTIIKQGVKYNVKCILGKPEQKLEVTVINGKINISYIYNKK